MDNARNPVTGGWFLKGETGEDSISYQKRAAERALLAQEWFAVYGPRSAPLLPLLPWDWDRMRYDCTGGPETLVGFYARSLSFRDWRVHDHPSFEDFARGLMVFPTSEVEPARTRWSSRSIHRSLLSAWAHFGSRDMLAASRYGPKKRPNVSWG
jgi:hypothetical protein